MINRLFRTKSISQILADADQPEHRLKKTLTVWDLTALGIGAIIGTGIFVLIGTAIVGDEHRPGAGPGIVLSFVLSGFTCALAALCYAEFAAMIPVAGSAYTFSYATLGEFLAWLTGWNLILEYGVACVAVAIGWSGYFNKLLKLAGVELNDRHALHPYSLRVKMLPPLDRRSHSDSKRPIRSHRLQSTRGHQTNEWLYVHVAPSS